MMTSQASKHHDPMYNFDTHFPERLSRLHLQSDHPAGSFRKKKSRAHRCGSRYKTQPVTFDEITEVDEEPNTDEKPKGETLMGQLQAFSRSMDGLVPKSSTDHVTHHISHSRSGSRKYHRHPDCIEEKVEAESGATSPQPQNLHQQQPPLFAGSVGGGGGGGVGVPDNRVAATMDNANPGLRTTTSDKSTSSVSAGSPTTTPTSRAECSDPSSVLDPGLAPANMAPRRQKVTAKAKKRQKAAEDGQIS